MSTILVRYAGWLVALGLLYGVGYLHGRGSVEPVLVETVRTEIEYVDRVVYRDVEVERVRDRVVYREKETTPDGTVREKETTTEQETTVETATEIDKGVREKREDTHSTEPGTVGAPPQYSLGILYRDPWDTDPGRPDPRRIEVTVGYRLVGPVWLQSTIRDGSGAIGIAVTFD